MNTEEIKTVLTNIHHLLKGYRNRPVWVFVRDMMGWGSHRATEFCKIVGWDPYAPCNHTIR